MKRKNSSYPKPAGSVLLDTLRQMGLGATLVRQSIVTRWPKIVDSVVGKRARAERLMGDTLYVVVDSSVWMNELCAIKYVLLEKLNANLDHDVPKIKDIRFTQLSWNRQSFKEPPACSPNNLTVSPPDEKSIMISKQGIDAVKDSETRRILERIIEKDACFKARRKTTA